MLYQSPADFCVKYAEFHKGKNTDVSGGGSRLDEVTVVSQTPDTARIEACWYSYGHAPDAGFDDVFERTAFVLVKRTYGWRLDSEEHLGYE
jgi:hypothetical protein